MIYKYNTINTKTRELEKEHNRKMKEYKKQEENERRRIKRRNTRNATRHMAIRM